MNAEEVNASLVPFCFRYNRTSLSVTPTVLPHRGTLASGVNL